MPTANEIICGPAEKVLKTMPDESVNCCISSPPFWALRDYGTATWEGGSLDCNHILENKERGDGDRKSCQPRGKYLTRDICKRCGAKRIDQQLGLEKTFELYIDKLCTIYDEVKRVLRPDGTCWVNLGDTYSNVGERKHGGFDGNNKNPDGSPRKSKYTGESMGKMNHDIPTKSLCLIPQRFAIEMVNRGWILRNVLIWHKPNPMPSSAKDRFTVDFEYVYFFVKSNETLSWIRPDGVMASKQPDYKSGEHGLDWQWGIRKGKRVKLSLWKGYCYFFEPIYEPFLEPERSGKPEKMWSPNVKDDEQLVSGGFGRGKYTHRIYNPLGRNKRTVWTIPTQAFPMAHFATFPEKLVEPMILAGCPREVCKKCGQGRRKVYETNYRNQSMTETEKYAQKNKDFGTNPTYGRGEVNHHFKGYTDCGCKAEWTPGVVLDPFSVAARLARSLPGTKETGLELNSSRNISKWRNAA